MHRSRITHKYCKVPRDVERGIIAPVLIGTPVEWCSPMVVTAKKNGKPRRTIDVQHLNFQCSREAYHCPSPFLAACQVPPNTKKTILDAVDGYHTIELDTESQPITTCSTHICRIKGCGGAGWPPHQ